MKKIAFFAMLLGFFLFMGGTKALAVNEENPFLIEINLDQHLLVVYENGEQVLSYAIAIGKPSTPSPLGEYRIVSKQVSWGDGFGTRWMGLNVPWGSYGIHGTNRPSSITQSVSHGCIRLHNADVEELYSIVPLGTRVSIIGQTWRIVEPTAGLKRGDSGQEIVFLQQKLNAIGFWAGFADGYYGDMTESAVKYFQSMHYLPQTGIADQEVLSLLYP